MKTALSFNDVLLVPQYSPMRSRSEVNISSAITPDLTLQVPIIAASMRTVTNMAVAVSMSTNGAIGMLPRFETMLEQIKNVQIIKNNKQKVIGTIGTKKDYLKDAEALINAGVDAITLDIAHAHSISGLEVISAFKNKFPTISLIAGTVATYLGTLDVFKSGADTVRVGIGGGTICTTRIVTGSGVPQITAIQEAVKAKKKFKNRFVLADGGMTSSGDIVKALACGASGVICGSLFAASNEAPGEIVNKDGILYKRYNGSSSLEEKRKQISLDKNHQKKEFLLHVEGVEALIKSSGSLQEILESLTAGIRSGFTYSGARNITELWKNAEFIQITNAGLKESFAHDVIEIKK